MATVPPPAKKPLPPPPSRNGAPLANDVSHVNFEISEGRIVNAQKVVLFGPGGIGKSELCSLIESLGLRALFLDIGDSTRFLNVNRIGPDKLSTWEALRAAVQRDWPDYDVIVIDDLTTGEELASSWTIRNVPHEKGHAVSSIEGYGFGKGMTHRYETFLQLLGDIDSQVRRGKFVICTAHECIAKVPNPAGEDWIRYEPRLQSPEGGKNSIRHRVKEWCDHLLFIGYDVAVADGKGEGAASRTIYPCELPFCMAKSRDLATPVPYSKGNPDLWVKLLHKELVDAATH